MKKIYATALLTIKEGIRQRIILGIFVFSLTACCFAVLIGGMFMRDIAKVIIDFCLTAVNLGGLLIPFFLAINFLSKDIENKTIFTILARTVSRSQYIIGTYFGLISLAVLIMVILTCATFLSIFTGQLLYGTDFFQSVSYVAISIAAIGSLFSVMLLSSLVILWSTLTANSFLVTILTFFTYIIGNSINDVVTFIKADISDVEISPITQTIINTVQFLFPNLAAFDLKAQAAHGIIMPPVQLLTLAGYGITYTVAVLALAVIFFKHRDIV